MTKLFDDYYDNHEPKSIYDNIRDLRRRLNRKKVLNVNVVEDEHAKIKKENMGKMMMRILIIKTAGRQDPLGSRARKRCLQLHFVNSAPTAVTIAKHCFCFWVQF